MGITHSPNVWGIDTSSVEHDTFKDLKKQVSIQQAENSLIPRAMYTIFGINLVTLTSVKTQQSLEHPVYC